MDVLISGCGIAGPNLAWWLLRGGHRVTIVEQAESLRTGGYIIDFWGKGYDLAERMGLQSRLEDIGYHVREVRFVGDEGRKRGGFDSRVFDRATGGRFISLPRGELARVLFEAVQHDVETVFGDEVTSLARAGDKVTATFAHRPAGRFDLVVGAEGIHSRTRDLVFGPEERFERFLGYAFAAYLLDDYPRREEDVYVAHGEPGRLAARFSLRDGSTLVMLVWREDGPVAVPHERQGKAALLRRRFAGGAWEVADLLAGLEGARDLYVDRVSQIEMDRWHEGRIALLGDAAYGPSFLAGQGAALAMIGGYVLAGELQRESAAIEPALTAYCERLAAFMHTKQEAARGMASSFVPRTELGLTFRAAATRLLGWGWFADMMIGRSLRDQVELPDYFPGV